MIQREIKFRAWDKITEAWLKEDAITIDGNGKVFVFGVYYEQNESIVINLNTGLKDKNNKPIYEGDIIIAANGTKCEIKFGEWQFSIHGYNGEETFTGIGFSFDGNEPLSESHGKPYEIIGNIYENPELLTPTKQ